MNEEREFYLLADVSRILNVMPHRIVYQLITRQVPEPTLRLGGKRIFCREDIKRLAERLQRSLPTDATMSSGGGK